MMKCHFSEVVWNFDERDNLSLADTYGIDLNDIREMSRKEKAQLIGLPDEFDIYYGKGTTVSNYRKQAVLEYGYEIYSAHLHCEKVKDRGDLDSR